LLGGDEDPPPPPPLFGVGGAVLSPASDDEGVGGGGVEHTVGHVPHLLTHNTFVSGPVGGAAWPLAVAASPLEDADTTADTSSARHSALAPSIGTRNARVLGNAAWLFASGNENEIPAALVRRVRGI